MTPLLTVLLSGCAATGADDSTTSAPPELLFATNGMRGCLAWSGALDCFGASQHEVPDLEQVISLDGGEEAVMCAIDSATQSVSCSFSSDTFVLDNLGSPAHAVSVGMYGVAAASEETITTTLGPPDDAGAAWSTSQTVTWQAPSRPAVLMRGIHGTFCAELDAGELWCDLNTDAAWDAFFLEEDYTPNPVVVATDVKTWGYDGSILTAVSSDGTSTIMSAGHVLDAGLDGEDVSAVSAHARCVLLEDGTVRCLEDHNVHVSPLLWREIPLRDTVTALDGGGTIDCALLADDSVWCWDSSKSSWDEDSFEPTLVRGEPSPASTETEDEQDTD